MGKATDSSEKLQYDTTMKSIKDNMFERVRDSLESRLFRRPTKMEAKDYVNQGAMRSVIEAAKSASKAEEGGLKISKEESNGIIKDAVSDALGVDAREISKTDVEKLRQRGTVLEVAEMIKSASEAKKDEAQIKNLAKKAMRSTLGVDDVSDTHFNRVRRDSGKEHVKNLKASGADKDTLKEAASRVLGKSKVTATDVNELIREAAGNTASDYMKLCIEDGGNQLDKCIREEVKAGILGVMDGNADLDDASVEEFIQKGLLGEAAGSIEACRRSKQAADECGSLQNLKEIISATTGLKAPSDEDALRLQEKIREEIFSKTAMAVEGANDIKEGEGKWDEHVSAIKKATGFDLSADANAMLSINIKHGSGAGRIASVAIACDVD